MNNVTLTIKQIRESAKIPVYASEGAACIDLFADIDSPAKFTIGDNTAIIPTGIAVEVPEGYAMMIYSRSGHGFKNDVRLANCVGIIDSDYRGEIMVKLTMDSYTTKDQFSVSPGDRIAQAMLIPVPSIRFNKVEALSSTARGDGGFGSTGK